MKDKKISVITIVKNGMPFIKSTVKSFNLQNYSNKELIIIYSDSEDGTENYLKNLKQDNIIIEKEISFHNRYAALNQGIKLLNGEIFGILHADDVFFNSDTLSLVGEKFNHNYDCIYGNILFSQNNNIKKIKRIWKSNDFKRDNLKYGWMPPHTSIFLKKEKLLEKPYNENYLISADYDFILKVFMRKDINIGFLNEYLSIMRLGGDSTKLSNFFLKFKEDIKISKNYFKYYYICVFLKILRKINQLQLFNKNFENDYLNKINLEIKN